MHSRPRRRTWWRTVSQVLFPHPVEQDLHLIRSRFRRPASCEVGRGEGGLEHYPLAGIDDREPGALLDLVLRPKLGRYRGLTLPRDEYFLAHGSTASQVLLKSC